MQFNNLTENQLRVLMKDGFSIILPKKLPKTYKLLNRKGDAIIFVQREETNKSLYNFTLNEENLEEEPSDAN